MSSDFNRTMRLQKGNMLVLALFAMVVLSLVGITMATLMASSERTIVNEVLGERAEQASRAGVEILANAAWPVNDNVFYTCANPSTFTVTRFSDVEGMDGCNIVTRCDSRIVNFSGGRDIHYEIKATASCSAGEFTAVKTNTRSMTRRQIY